ncbi:uncharacterized protein G6M90_00g050680 [Metarhizium brunneum]|uniref:Secreted protein n=1 Tax=Metarhizium brunneum TaxID=500148 RepID=A0A7D5UVR8_9HYPO|nr:hypothetical protein G6M90_00g050680 [Metarhizium brunneum]
MYSLGLLAVAFAALVAGQYWDVAAVLWNEQGQSFMVGRVDQCVDIPPPIRGHVQWFELGPRSSGCIFFLENGCLVESEVATYDGNVDPVPDDVNQSRSIFCDELLSSLDILDYDESRRKLETSCKKLPLYSKCPTRDILENTNKQWSPVCYRQAGRTPAKESSRLSPSYEQNPENWNLFVNPETRMQYSKQGGFVEWTNKCKDGSSTTAVAVRSIMMEELR